MARKRIPVPLMLCLRITHPVLDPTIWIKQQESTKRTDVCRMTSTNIQHGLPAEVPCESLPPHFHNYNVRRFRLHSIRHTMPTRVGTLTTYDDQQCKAMWPRMAIGVAAVFTHESPSLGRDDNCRGSSGHFIILHPPHPFNHTP